MLKKATTSTGLVILGLSSIANGSISNGYNGYNAEDINPIEFVHLGLSNVKTNIDNYVDTQYIYRKNISDRYSSLEYSFMHIAENFSQGQVDLDYDFSQSLKKLFESKLHSKPSKKRF